MSNFAQRMLTALIAGSVSIAAIVFSSHGLLVFCAIVSGLGVWEFLTISGEPVRYRRLAAALVALIWLALLLRQVWLPQPFYHLPNVTWETLLLLGGLLVLPIVAIMDLFDARETNATHTIGTFLMGFVYTVLPLVLLYQVAFTHGYALHQPGGSRFTGVYAYAIPLSVLFLNWFLDSFAYLGGRAFGKHPLYPRISPKKTWEGSIFGSLVCVALGYGLTHYGVAGIDWVPVAVIISVVSQLGDLVESMIKRNASIKDSGSLLPGHGGILDRFDGLYISMPVVYVWLSLVV